MIVKIEMPIKITPGDIDDIMVTALEGGITYWCDKAEVVGQYLGEYASEQISHAGELKLYADGESYILNEAKLISGLKLYLSKNSEPICDGGIDAGAIDAEAADCIIQYAIFGEIVYG